MDHFPSTHGTWIERQLDAIADVSRLTDPEAPGRAPAPDTKQMADLRRALRQHLMSRYARALTAYVSGSSFRQLGDADDLVGGFFVRALSDDEFLFRWRQSGMPLRRWLMNAMSFHCRGLVRDLARERGRTLGTHPVTRPHHAAGIDALVAGSDHEASRSFERAWALAIVNQAYGSVQAALRSEGRDQDDAVLRMHVIESMTYDQVASALGMTRQECFNAMRRIAPRVRAAMRELLREEGVTESTLDAAIADVMRLVGAGRSGA